MKKRKKEEAREEMRWSLVKHKTGKRSARCTRSQKFPDWTMQELLVLVNEVAAVETEADYLVSMSSYQKWKLVSDNCNSLGVCRSLNQCRKQWEHLVDDYKVIKDWEFQSGISYWSLDKETLLEVGLPLSFDKHLFLFIHDNVNAQAGADSDSDPDFKLLGSSGLKKKRRCQRPQDSKNDELPEVAAKLYDQADQRKHQQQEEMIVKLQEQADLIHAILKGVVNCNSYNDLKSPEEVQIEKSRWQGSELIKVFGSLAGTIEQLSHIVQEGR